MTKKLEEIYNNRLIENTVPVLVGALLFFIILGFNVLNPTNISWIVYDDPKQHYLGWLFFRFSNWSFPIGLNPAYGLEFGNAIVFSDSLPLFAFLFKPFSAILPETFQYSGLWLLVCFILQAWFAWKLVGLFSDRIAIRALSAGIFAMAPPMLMRLMPHFSLAGQFLLLAALYFALHPQLLKRKLAWSLLIVIAGLVHFYLFTMVMVIWFADFVWKIIQKKLPLKTSVIELTVIFLLNGMLYWKAGYSAVGGGFVSRSAEYGGAAMNLLSIFDSSTWSYILKPIPTGTRLNSEGFNFLGLGVILLLIFTIPLIFFGKTNLIGAIRKFPVLLLAFVALTLFALSNKIGIGPFRYEFFIPETLLKYASTWRASGRMFWPVFYAIIFVIIFAIVRGYNHRAAVFLLAFSFIVQVIDTSAFWFQSPHEHRFVASIKPESTWSTPLHDPFWEKAAAKYKKVRWIPTEYRSPEWKTIGYYAGTHGLGTDAVYLAHHNILATDQAVLKGAHALTSGKYEPDSLYFVSEKSIQQAILTLDHTADVLARIDGFTVLAPGWKKCITCLPVVNELKVTDIIPPINIDEKIPATENGIALPYFASGWSVAEQWGIWSAASMAKIIFPMPRLGVHSILIEANALVTPEHPKQQVLVKINGILVLTETLTKSSDNLIAITVPDTLKEKISEKGLVEVQLEFPDAITPKKLGINEDQRKLALGIVAITVT